MPAATALDEEVAFLYNLLRVTFLPSRPELTLQPYAELNLLTDLYSRKSLKWALYTAIFTILNTPILKKIKIMAIYKFRIDPLLHSKNISTCAP